MKFLVSQLSYFFEEPKARANVNALLKYVLFLTAVIIVFTIMFHVLMVHVEKQTHSWLTGFYWTLTVMSTLGFGDITFHSDLGRAFSILVLLSGVVLLLIMLPFTFIRHLYAPWLEAQIRLQAPRSVPPDTKGHVIICRHESTCRGVIRKLEFNKIPYFVIEPDPVAAANMISEHLSIVTGDLDNRETYENMRVSQARAVFANAEDTTNSNIALTVREADANVPIIALADEVDAIDILELSGATHVLPIKQRLGEHLATRVRAGTRSVQTIGRFKGLRIGEFLAHDTFLVGQTLQESRLRQDFGVNVVGVRERGRLHSVTADLRFHENSLPVVVGTEGQLEKLNNRLGSREAQKRPVLIIGGGKVGIAAANSLRARGVAVSIVEKEESSRRSLRQAGLDCVIGDAADREVLVEAGFEDASAVVLTTNDDAVNIYLTVYCRRLKPDINIVSRITLERNIDAIYRAGADSVLSYASLGREHVIAALHGRDPVLVGEGADFFLVPMPTQLVDKTLAESEIGTRTGLIVMAVEDHEMTIANPGPDLKLEEEQRLLMLGTAEQRQTFSKTYGPSRFPSG
ncbi:MAG: NAD-binding protein [Planctomycetota bacterium]